MNRELLTNASDALLGIIVEQGEARLVAQSTFADVQDARAVVLTEAAASLAAAAAAVAVAASAVDQGGHPALVGAAITAVVGFTAAGFAALWSVQSGNFHTVGWYPEDFAQDIAARASARNITEDRVLDLQIRLTYNRDQLDRRGRWFNGAAAILALTPIVALALGAFLAAVT